MVAQNRMLHHDWDRYDTRHVVFRPVGMTARQLEDGYWRAYRDFYRWSAIWRGATDQTRRAGPASAPRVRRRLEEVRAAVGSCSSAPARCCTPCRCWSRCWAASAPGRAAGPTGLTTGNNCHVGRRGQLAWWAGYGLIAAAIGLAVVLVPPLVRPVIGDVLGLNGCPPRPADHGGGSAVRPVGPPGVHRLLPGAHDAPAHADLVGQLRDRLPMARHRPEPPADRDRAGAEGLAGRPGPVR